ncbi:MAG TPA: OmpA family protein [Burkholderiaceae bacterium]|nr:OmpA family protein [Burkholderiaceae bacterium]
MPRLFPTAAALLLGAAASLLAHAGEVKVFRASEAVDPGEVARILNSGAPIKMRSLRLLDDGPAAVVASDAARPSALSLPVPFAFDSADILPQAKVQLDAVAAGIRLLPPTQKVVIEGHTDALGSEAYNDDLSQRRAQSVRRYLVATYGIDASRLQAEGLGKQDPLPGISPLAGENRRVQFRGQ